MPLDNNKDEGRFPSAGQLILDVLFGALIPLLNAVAFLFLVIFKPRKTFASIGLRDGGDIFPFQNLRKRQGGEASSFPTITSILASALVLYTLTYSISASFRTDEKEVIDIRKGEIAAFCSDSGYTFPGLAPQAQCTAEAEVLERLSQSSTLQQCMSAMTDWYLSPCNAGNEVDLSAFSEPINLVALIFGTWLVSVVFWLGVGRKRVSLKAVLSYWLHFSAFSLLLASLLFILLLPFDFSRLFAFEKAPLIGLVLDIGAPIIIAGLISYIWANLILPLTVLPKCLSISFGRTVWGLTAMYLGPLIALLLLLSPLVLLAFFL